MENLGKIAYEEYCKYLMGHNWRSGFTEDGLTGLIRGGRLPDWHELSIFVQSAWNATALKVVEESNGNNTLG